MKRTIIFFVVLYMCSGFNLVMGNDSLYKELPVTLHTATGDLFGTLTVPVQKTRMPVALIIAGSGPTDRNGNNPMMKNESLHKLAIALADSGIASLRYDKRAIAESKAAAKSEADLRFDDYVGDARDWISLLRKDNRFSKIIVIGHSEGSLIGMVAANKNADAFVSIAGAGRPADKILKEQLDKQPQAVKDLSFPIIDSLVAGNTVSTVNPMLFSLFRPSVQPYLISLFKYDPAIEIKKLTIPVLIIQGTNDIQVSMEDAELLAKASKASLVAIDHMNHIFRIVEGDRNANISTYNDASLPIADELSNSIVRFIRKMKQ